MFHVRVVGAGAISTVCYWINPLACMLHQLPEFPDWLASSDCSIGRKGMAPPWLEGDRASWAARQGGKPAAGQNVLRSKTHFNTQLTEIIQ